MPVETILLFFIADLAICLTPGPATAVTASYAASGGMRGAMGPIAGIHIGNFIWYTMSAFGLVALVTTAPDIYRAIRWAGVVYLLWMGWRMIAKASAPLESNPKMRNTRFWRGFGSGLAVHMSNPKALLFYASFLPQFIDPAISIPFQILVFATVTIFTESIGLLTYSFIASSVTKFATGKSAGGRHANFSFDTLAGYILIGVAFIMLILNTRS